MTPEDKVGLTKRQIRITEQAEKAVEKARRRLNALEAELVGVRTTLRDAEAELRRINELGDCL